MGVGMSMANILRQLVDAGIAPDKIPAIVEAIEAHCAAETVVNIAGDRIGDSIGDIAKPEPQWKINKRARDRARLAEQRAKAKGQVANELATSEDVAIAITGVSPIMIGDNQDLSGDVANVANQIGDKLATPLAIGDSVANGESILLFSNLDSEKVKIEDTQARAIDDAAKEFWAIYPVRAGATGKAEAIKKFKKLAAKHGIEPILAGARRHAAFCAMEYPGRSKYIPMASTWLNQERWNEHPIPHDNSGGLMAHFDERIAQYGAAQPSGDAGSIRQDRHELDDPIGDIPSCLDRRATAGGLD